MSETRSESKGKTIMTRSEPAPNSPKPAGKTVARFPEPADKDKAQDLADLALQPSVNAALVTLEYITPAFGEQDLGSLVKSLTEHATKLEAGDLSHCEAMLEGQAHALQAIFVNLARRATRQEYLQQWDAYIRMALKAQSQCRMTLETLATIKNPPVLFAKQANVTTGPQQINNGIMEASRPRENEITPNKLLEANNGERLDTRAQGAASGANSDLEAVGAIDRPEVTRR